jgi:hypothetical protein
LTRKLLEQARLLLKKKKETKRLKTQLKEAQARTEKAQIEAGTLTERFGHFISLDRLPPRMIQETSYDHAVRVVKMLRFMGYGTEQAYRQVAQHTGVQPREVYTMFMYVGNGDFMASMG